MKIILGSIDQSKNIDNLVLIPWCLFVEQGFPSGRFITLCDQFVIAINYIKNIFDLIHKARGSQ